MQKVSLREILMSKNLSPVHWGYPAENKKIQQSVSEMVFTEKDKAFIRNFNLIKSYTDYGDL